MRNASGGFVTNARNLINNTVIALSFAQEFQLNYPIALSGLFSELTQRRVNALYITDVLNPDAKEPIQIDVRFRNDGGSEGVKEQLYRFATMIYSIQTPEVGLFGFRNYRANLHARIRNYHVLLGNVLPKFISTATRQRPRSLHADVEYEGLRTLAGQQQKKREGGIDRAEKRPSVARYVNDR